MTSLSSLSSPDMFTGSEISELCDSIKDVHRLLKSVGDLLTELEETDDSGGNCLHLDFKRWGIRTITKDLLTRQYNKINRMMIIYQEEQKRMKEMGIFGKNG
ncbi:hypothetical protein [Desulfoluna butyratoxydans]|uniref:Uncharacterized protein n=1 Tax=Desulfoluna butyratoxydans TaxID=231438 RepID=A0A4U8YPY6_9BACT|nr:hypothetical protein [Desulfoluna butyratoxydans]VFQ45309.1 hypothetical protein MSL71_29660 [Desulfoluna butyratoxydans]